MLYNLRRDLQRYCDWKGYGKNAGFGYKIKVFCTSPGYWAILHHRFGFWVNRSFGEGYRNPLKVILKSFYFFLKIFVVYVAKVDILITADIGAGLFLSNRGNIILGLEQMGENCTIHYNITVGQGIEGATPKFGNNIWIGHDSIVYGPLTIGDNTIIESGTVLAKSLPGNLQVGGNPCRILQRNIEAGPYMINRHGT